MSVRHSDKNSESFMEEEDPKLSQRSLERKTSSTSPLRHSTHITPEKITAPHRKHRQTKTTGYSTFQIMEAEEFAHALTEIMTLDSEFEVFRQELSLRNDFNLPLFFKYFDLDGCGYFGI
jgi:hypothetical protein